MSETAGFDRLAAGQTPCDGSEYDMGDAANFFFAVTVVMSREDVNRQAVEQRVEFVKAAGLPDWAVHEDEDLPRSAILREVLFQPVELPARNPLDRFPA